MNWKRYYRCGHSPYPTARLYSCGRIYFNQATVLRYELKRFRWMVLYYDAERQAIAFCPVKKQILGALRLKQQEVAMVVQARGFLRRFGVQMDPRRPYLVHGGHWPHSLVIGLNDDTA